MTREQQLLVRLEEIGLSLSRTDGALALFGLGSVGRDTYRIDAYSDLDFFVVVTPSSKERFQVNFDWLESVAPLAFVHRDGGDGARFLFADGIYGEMAVFTPDGLRGAVFEPGRLIWAHSGISDSIALPTVPLPSPPSRDVPWLLNEILCNLYVGLSRFRRGEKLAAYHEIQGYAFDRILELASILEPDSSDLRDPFAPRRRFEKRFPQMSGHLADFLPGYNRTPESAASILDFLESRYPINPAMVSAIRRLLDE